MESFLHNFSCTNLLAPLPGGERCPRPGFDADLEQLTVEKVLDLGKAVDSYTQHASGVLGPLWATADVLTATLRGFAGESKTGGDNQTSGTVQQRDVARPARHHVTPLPLLSRLGDL
jgi:hypothetical protein